MTARLATGLAALALLASACDRESLWYGTTTPRHGTGEFWINNGGEPEWIDPGKCSDQVGGAIINNAFEGLTAPDPKTLAPTPGMATSWTLSPDKLTWTFTLRESGWSDGTPVTAGDFVYSWARVLDPATLAKYGDQLYDVANGDAFHQRALHVSGFTGDADALAAKMSAFGKVARVKKNPLEAEGASFFVFFDESSDELRKKVLAADLGAGVKTRLAAREDLGLAAPDDRTFVVRLEQPVPYFLAKITTLYTTYPVPRWVIERLEKEGKSPDLWTRPEYFVGNGAFVLKEHRFRSYMIFEPNPHYWDRATITLKRIKVLEIDSYNTTLQMYKAGEIDWIGETSNVPSELSAYLRTKKDFRFTGFTTTYWYWFNTTDPALKDKRVRHALNLATDKKRIVEAVTRQFQIPATSYIQGGLAGYEKIPGEPYDPEKARALLAAAGYPGGKGLPAITISYNTSETHKAIAEAIQEMWRKELGIDAQIRNEEWKVFLHHLELGEYQVGRLGWTADYPDPYTFLSVFLTTSGNNHSRWKDKEYDRLVEDANAQSDPQERLRRLAKAEEYLLDAMPAMPIYYYTRSYMVKPYVKGLHNNFQDRHPWKSIWIDPDAVARGEVEDGNGGFVDLGAGAAR